LKSLTLITDIHNLTTKIIKLIFNPTFGAARIVLHRAVTDSHGHVTQLVKLSRRSKLFAGPNKQLVVQKSVCGELLKWASRIRRPGLGTYGLLTLQPISGSLHFPC